LDFLEETTSVELASKINPRSDPHSPISNSLKNIQILQEVPESQYDGDVVKVAVGQGSGDPGAKQPLPAALAPEQQHVACIDILEEVLLTDAVEVPEEVLGRQEVEVDGHVGGPEITVLSTPLLPISSLNLLLYDVL